MHCSMMRTTRALTVFPGGGGGGSAWSGEGWWSGIHPLLPPLTRHPLPPPPPCEQTDACENIAFARFAKRAVIIYKYKA